MKWMSGLLFGTRSRTVLQGGTMALHKQTRPFQKKFYFEAATPFDVEANSIGILF
ncbi:hypothetical protein [Carnobacterium alterfunditum]|uniref:hypothetical protein n=1 Tax=Carnobacterium alterfunditum TaxID=28230 RepID=UPI0012E0A28D|nr:hypothetical protein [Carnobacterium alterfunditum]